MQWPDELARDLPAPHDDEPASLRQDIVDELADHLACALRREQHRTANPQQAEQNVLAQFGDPARIARQLWFEAMQEKLMSQRLTLAFVAVIALASLAATGMAWQSMQQGREANRLLLQQSQEFNTAVLARLETLSQQAPPAPVSPEWNPVKFRLVIGESGGPPAEGFSVKLTTTTDETANKLSYHETTEADGIADFGLLRPGGYSIEVVSPWNDVARLNLIVRPGTSMSKEIVCPASAIETGDVAVTIDWPDDLRDRGLWVQCRFSAERIISGRDWKVENYQTSGGSHWHSSYQRLIVDNENRLGYWPALLGDAEPIEGDETDSHKADLQETVPWLARKYRLELIRIESAPGPSPGDESRGLGASLGWCSNRRMLSNIAFSSAGFDDRYAYAAYAARRSGGFRATRRPDPDAVRAGTPDQIMSDQPIEFEVKPGQVNHWTITLPDELIEVVRKSLAEQESASE